MLSRVLMTAACATMLAGMCFAGAGARVGEPMLLGFAKAGHACAGSWLLPGSTIDGTNRPGSIITDIAPVVIDKGTGKHQVIWFVAWVYTTPGGHYFELAGSLVRNQPNRLQFSGPAPFVSGFNGNYKAIILRTLKVEGYAGTTLAKLPIPLNYLANPGTALIHLHSCYHA